MKQLKKLVALLIVITSIGSPAFTQTQDAFNLDAMLRFNGMLELQEAQANEKKQERAREVMQENGYIFTGSEDGIFVSNSLMLNGKPLDFGEFNLSSNGVLTVMNGSIPFHVYLKRNGTKVLIPGQEQTDLVQIKIDISTVLRHARAGDYLVIEAVNKEDGVKCKLKLLPLGC